MVASLIVYFCNTVEKKASWYYRIADNILKNWFFGRIEDFIGILGTLSGCMVLVGRVIEGQCPPGTSIWNSQHCNPVADAGSFPQDELILINLFPIICQGLVKGITLQAVAA